MRVARYLRQQPRHGRHARGLGLRRLRDLPLGLRRRTALSELSRDCIGPLPQPAASAAGRLAKEDGEGGGGG